MSIGNTLAFLPQTPVISRFVAPWDTSGWYYAAADFQAGCRLYSNADVYAADVPESLLHGDYIVVYDSSAEGFDDKQGMDFDVEQAAYVTVALPVGASPLFLTGFTDLGQTLGTACGAEYRLYRRAYEAGAHVSLPEFSGNCRHYSVIVNGVAPPQPVPCPQTVPLARDLGVFCGTAPRWYVQDVFNGLPLNAAPEGYACQGDCAAVGCQPDARRKAVRLQNGARLQKPVTTGGADEAELALTVSHGSAILDWCGATLTLFAQQAVLGDGQSIGDELNGRYHVRFLRAGGRCEVWLNCRPAGTLLCRAEPTAMFTLAVSGDGCAELDRLSIRDQPDRPAVDERFGNLAKDWVVAQDATLSAVAYPFEDSVCLLLQGKNTPSAAYTFAAMRGGLRIETAVMPTDGSYTVLAEACDATGALALRVAMYKHNLYATNGDRWERILGGHISGMYYPDNNWYRLRLAVDCATGLYDLYVDGARRAKGFRLATPVSHIAQVRYLTCGEKLYVADLRVYDHASASADCLPPAPVIDVTAAPYGAKGDGVTPDTRAIQQALDAAAFTGATVFLPSGAYLCGELFLRSDITVWVSRGATLLGSQDYTLYPLMTPGHSLCANRQLGRGLLYGEGLVNVRITGGGTLDGNGRCRFKMNDPLADRERDARPDQIYIAYSDGVTLRDLNIVNSAFWSVVPLSCRNVLIEQLNVDSMNTPNRDGIDPVDCVDMTVRDCNIIAGDDGLCLKSSDVLGCRNIRIEGLMIQSLASGIKFGTDSYHSLVNVSISHCTFKNINRCGIALESVDGAVIENICISHLDMTDVGAPVYIALGVRHRCPRGGHAVREGHVNDIAFRHLRFRLPYAFSRAEGISEVMVIGASDRQRINDVRFEDCRFALPGGAAEIPPAPAPLGKRYPEYDQHGRSAGAAFTLRYAANIRFERCTASLTRADVRPLVASFDCEAVTVSETCGVLPAESDV